MSTNSEVTAFNLQPYIDLLNLYFSFPDLEFHALLVDRRDPQFNLAPWHNDVWHAYVTFVHALLQRRLKRDVFAIIDLQGKPNEATMDLEDTICRTPHVRGCLRATSDMSIFLQLVDVLLGHALDKSYPASPRANSSSGDPDALEKRRGSGAPCADCGGDWSRYDGRSH